MGWLGDLMSTSRPGTPCYLGNTNNYSNMYRCICLGNVYMHNVHTQPAERTFKEMPHLAV